MPTVTVRDVLRLAVPPGTTISAGSAGIAHQVTWVATLRATLPAFAELRGGELALLSVEGAKALDLTLAVLVQRLAQAPVPVAGIVVLGAATADDIQAAEEFHLPLLMLPPGSDLRETEREITRLIADYEAQFERRSAQLYDVLTQQSLAGNGVTGLVETLAERTGQSVACYLPNGELRVQRGRGSARIALQALRPMAGGDYSLLNQQLWAEPIGTSGYPTGFLVIGGSVLDAWDREAATRGAAALGLELAKTQAAQAVEDRLRGDFLSSILTGQSVDMTALMQRGQELGYDLNLPHTAMLFHVENGTPAVLNRLQSSIQNEAMRRNVAVPISRREGSVTCMWPLQSALMRPRDVAEHLRQHLIADYPSLALSIGTAAPGLGEWRRTLEEAEQALLLGRQLFGTERVLAFGDLGVYRLLVRLRETPELWTFYRETLSSLAAYDQRQSGELLRTLEAYFNHLGNLRATSEALHVHRNTLLYRIERIKEISRMDLNNAEEHFSLWLALRAHRILGTLEEG